jgi:hypothetical protein
MIANASKPSSRREERLKGKFQIGLVKVFSIWYRFAVILNNPQTDEFEPLDPQLSKKELEDRYDKRGPDEKSFLIEKKDARRIYYQNTCAVFFESQMQFQALVLAFIDSRVVEAFSRLQPKSVKQ